MSEPDPAEQPGERSHIVGLGDQHLGLEDESGSAGVMQLVRVSRCVVGDTPVRRRSAWLHIWLAGGEDIGVSGKAKEKEEGDVSRVVRLSW